MIKLDLSGITVEFLHIYMDTGISQEPLHLFKKITFTFSVKVCEHICKYVFYKFPIIRTVSGNFSGIMMDTLRVSCFVRSCWKKQVYITGFG